MNDLNSKLDDLHRIVKKLDTYYDHNNLKITSVLDLSQKLDSLERALDQKANSLDLKKLIPRVHELTETHWILDCKLINFD